VRAAALEARRDALIVESVAELLNLEVNIALIARPKAIEL